MPNRLRVPQGRVSPADNLGAALAADQQYFEIRINELYLTYQRKWFAEYDPMVLVISEFSYAGQPTAVPVVVGPAMLSQLNPNTKAPAGMVFANTCAVGPHPYRGGEIALTVILYRSKREDHARKLLDLVENMAKALDFAVPVSAYLKVAGAVMDGVEVLTGTDGTADPLIGRRDAFSPVEPAYYVLTNAPEADLGDLWVRDKCLVQGTSPEKATSFRQAEYVLYSITTAKRDDVSKLPFYPTWQHVLQEVNKSSKQDIWDSAKANMAALLGMLDTSPDLTEPHKAALADKWIATMKTLHERAVSTSSLAPAREAVPPSDLDRVRAKAVSVLHM
jgi:hypothetical protein